LYFLIWIKEFSMNSNPSRDRQGAEIKIKLRLLTRAARIAKNPD